jgi:hypothetical protein
MKFVFNYDLFVTDTQVCVLQAYGQMIFQVLIVDFINCRVFLK